LICQAYRQMKMFSQVKWLKALPGNIDRLAGALFALL